MIESFRLRHQVFNQEFLENDKPGLDFDKFDYYFDHLIIVHKESKKIIGTYRLNSSSYSKESYTATEFDLTFMKNRNLTMLELGRACIQKEYRKGSVISLLWRGIAEYMNLCEAQILFGCSSLKISNARDAALVYKYLLEQNSVEQNSRCAPIGKFVMKDFDAWFSYFQKELTENQRLEAEGLIPSLLKSYLKLGAKVASEPAYDEEFECVDLLTVLRKEDLANSLAVRFQIAR